MRAESKIVTGIKFGGPFSPFSFFWTARSYEKLDLRWITSIINPRNRVGERSSLTAHRKVARRGPLG